MNVEFVPYQEALELHNLGALFPNPGFPHLAIYRNGDLSFANEAAIEMFVEDFKDEVVVAPLYQQVFRWFREKYGWVAEIDGSLQFNHFYANLLLQGKGEVFNIKMCDTYEEAELVCLRKLIEIVKNK